jgi:NDP-sugar pyrophosphorylase family protein
MIASFIPSFQKVFPDLILQMPWMITADLPSHLLSLQKTLGGDYKVKGDVAIHKLANIEEGVVLKGPLIISKNCFLGAHAYLRGGVYLGEGVGIGPGCEIKTSLVFPETAFAHFNFVGDSIVGRGVNLEAGAIIANHYNERKNKAIDVLVSGERVSTGTTKFGALLGDGCRIGANAVLAPGTILPPNSIVQRLELIEQVKYIE